MLIEYMKPPCSSIQDAPEFNPCQLDGVWFTDRSARKIQGKWQGMAAAVFVAEEPVVTEQIKDFAQLAELYAIVLVLRNCAQAIYIDSYAVWASAAQWLRNWANSPHISVYREANIGSKYKILPTVILLL